MIAVNCPAGTSRVTPRSAWTAASPVAEVAGQRVAATAAGGRARGRGGGVEHCGSFRWSSDGQAASRPMRERAWVSAPADSSAEVASASSRPRMPRPGGRRPTRGPRCRRRRAEGRRRRRARRGRRRRAPAGRGRPRGPRRRSRPPAGQAAADAGAAAGVEPRRVEVVDVEVDGRPARARVGVGEHVEHGLRRGVDGGGGGPGLHDAERSHRAAPRVVGLGDDLAGPRTDPGSSSGMTRDRRPEDVASRARLRLRPVQPSARYRRVRALPPPVFDAVLARAAAASRRSPSSSSDAGRRASTSRSASGRRRDATMLGFRRRLPVTALAAQFAGFIVMSQVAGPAWTTTSSSRSSRPVASFNLGARTEGRHLWSGVSRRLALSCVDAATTPSRTTIVVLLGGSTIAGPAARPRLRPLAAQPRAAREGARAGREPGQRRGAAALDERTRIAGELHDIVAHALSGMIVQASAARRMAERDPARAEAAFATVETTGREALTELRRLLGVLRREDEELALAPRRASPTSARSCAARGRRPAGRAAGRGRAAPAAGRRRPHRLPRGAGGADPRPRRRGGPRRRDRRYGASDLERRGHRRRRAGRPPAARHARARRGLRREVQAGATGEGGWRVTARLPIGRPTSAAPLPLEPTA